MLGRGPGRGPGKGDGRQNRSLGGGAVLPSPKHPLGQAHWLQKMGNTGAAFQQILFVHQLFCNSADFLSNILGKPESILNHISTGLLRLYSRTLQGSALPSQRNAADSNCFLHTAQNFLLKWPGGPKQCATGTCIGGKTIYTL